MTSTFLGSFSMSENSAGQEGRHIEQDVNVSVRWAWGLHYFRLFALCDKTYALFSWLQNNCNMLTLWLESLCIMLSWQIFYLPSVCFTEASYQYFPQTWRVTICWPPVVTTGQCTRVWTVKEALTCVVDASVSISVSSLDHGLCFLVRERSWWGCSLDSWQNVPVAMPSAFWNIQRGLIPLSSVKYETSACSLLA